MRQGGVCVKMNKHRKNILIAIDGPAGAGKSTIAKLLAKKLGIDYMDTGAMYRAITYKFLNNKIDLDNVEDMANILKNTDINYENGSIFLDGKKMDNYIRTEEINENVSKVSGYGFVREKLVQIQRNLSKDKSFVLDGRDIGTVVLPNADFKIFLTATAEERAKRRFEQDKGKSTLTYEQTLNEIKKRDEYDSTRDISPLRKSEDAFEVDSTKLSVEQTADLIFSIIEGKL